MPRAVITSPLRLWVRHRCAGSTTPVFFNDYTVRIPSLPGVTRGCPFCWVDGHTLARNWWERYRLRAPVAAPEEVAAAVIDVVRRLERPGCPDDAICSHFGASPVASLGGLNMNVCVCSRSPHLQVNMYQSLYPRPAVLHAARSVAVADGLVTSVINKWNGKDGHYGISVVLSRSPPDALVHAIRNYVALGFHIFDETPEIRARFNAFIDWYRAPFAEGNLKCPP